MEESAEIHRAFAYEYEGEIIIFYRDNLEGEQLLFAIAHEIGHLVLQHDENNHSAESEADEFARLLIGDYAYLKGAALILASALIVVLIIKSYSNIGIATNNNTTVYPKTESTTITEIIESIQERSEFKLTTAIETSAPNQEIETEETTYIVDPEHAVYISKSGDKYHRIDCYHINADNYTMMSEDQAISLGYEPCKTCRPGVELIEPGRDKHESNTEYIAEPETKFVTNESETETSTEIQPIEINRATIEDFMTVPGIDKEKASAILDLRSAIHGFQHPYEILYAEGVSQEFLASIIDYLYIDPSESTT